MSANRLTRDLATLGLAWAVLAMASADPARAETQRFALLAGANDGGSDRVKLRYAITDAEAMSQVLVKLGGVRPDDSQLVVEPDVDGLRAAFAALHTRIGAAKAKGDRVEVLIYYSGHADENGLLLRGRRFEYKELKRLIKGLPADVRVAVIDSCASGALIRTKGGKRRAPFLIDTSTRVTGHAILTSSSANEAAQESDRIKGSFFTHYLVSALRGAADTTGDGRVTLGEAYQFAFDETLARTERTQSGAQHPNYDIQLAGTGDLVMTDLRGTSATLAVVEGVEGRIFIRDADGRLVAELAKIAERRVSLGLDPGRYRVTVETSERSEGGEGLFEADVQLAHGETAELKPGDLTTVTVEKTAARKGSVSHPHPEPGDPIVEIIETEETVEHGGVEVAEEDDVEDGEVGMPPISALRKKYRIRTLHFGLVGYGAEDVVDRLDISLLSTHGAGLYGFEMALGWTARTAFARGAQIAIGANLVGGPVSGFQGAVGANIAGGRVDGFQGAVGANIADALTGVQSAVGANIVAGRVEGAQMAVGANIAEDLSGAQLGVGPNIARDVEGAQIATVNIARDVKGAQIGILNIASGKADFQLGLVNIAGDADVPIGLISITDKGRKNLEVFASDSHDANLAVKFGGRRFYSILSAGIQARRDPIQWKAGGGFGFNIPLSARTYLDLDLLGFAVFQGGTFQAGDADILGQLKLSVGFQILERLGLFVGASANTSVALERIGGSMSGITEHVEIGSDQTTVRVWPGFFAGVIF